MDAKLMETVFGYSLDKQCTGLLVILKKVILMTSFEMDILIRITTDKKILPPLVDIKFNHRASPSE